MKRLIFLGFVCFLVASCGDAGGCFENSCPSGHFCAEDGACVEAGYEYQPAVTGQNAYAPPYESGAGKTCPVGAHLTATGKCAFCPTGASWSEAEQFCFAEQTSAPARDGQATVTCPDGTHVDVTVNACVCEAVDNVNVDNNNDVDVNVNERPLSTVECQTNQVDWCYTPTGCKIGITHCQNRQWGACQYYNEECGDGVDNDCDGLTDESCSPNPMPDPDPDPSGVCGNDILDAGEECDYTKLNGESCAKHGWSGELWCNTDCTFHWEACSGGDVSQTCGNGVLDAGEECDYTQLDGESCVKHGWIGTLWCNADCTFHWEACSGGEVSPTCGNGVLDAGEECDYTQLDGESCAKHGWSGTLWCNADCTFHWEACSGGDSSPTCGNDVIDAGEECDYTKLNGESCAKHGWTGTLWCNADCTFHWEACSGSSAPTETGDDVVAEPCPYEANCVKLNRKYVSNDTEVWILGDCPQLGITYVWDGRMGPFYDGDMDGWIEFRFQPSDILYSGVCEFTYVQYDSSNSGHPIDWADYGAICDESDPQAVAGGYLWCTGTGAALKMYLPGATAAGGNQ
ncbi:MAG TPA: hypothetical protein VMX18_01640 [Candidatus Bipolaricaulota bacterium]|nr:hypothetical protein [Candidatus Bipolaricaulota bacterium]